MSRPSSVAEDAKLIADRLEWVRRNLRDSISSAARAYPVPLTPPQMLALQTLVEEARERQNGLSLSELSERMGLAHSTASGIVARLVGRGLLQRSQRAEDRRFVRIELTQPVKEWVEHELPASRLRPLIAALEKAEDKDRDAIIDGLAALERLLTESSRS